MFEANVIRDYDSTPYRTVAADYMVLSTASLGAADWGLAPTLDIGALLGLTPAWKDMFDCAPPLEIVGSPRYALPDKACDAHCHIFGPSTRFPFAEDRSYTPPDAPFEQLQALHRKLGISRSVLVQAACHGNDMSAVLDAISRGNGQYRGVALVRPDVSAQEIERLDRGGIRGVRFNFVSHLPAPAMSDLQAIAELISPHGWHFCIHADEQSLSGLTPMLRALDLPVIIDHMGRVNAGKGLESESFKSLLQLAQRPNVWIKISGIDRISTSGKRPFADGRPFVTELIQHLPERLLWGTDWPHPNVRGDMPDDAELVNTFCELCPDTALREQILVHNPQALYRFDAPGASS